MKKEKSFRLINLIKLYLSFLFQKTTIVIFSISLLLILGIEILISNPNMDINDYMQGFEEIHLNFFTQSFFILQLFNSIIIATITISYTIFSNSFDTLFLSHTPRTKLCLAKLLSSIIVLLTLNVYEILIINIIPLIKFPYFKLSLDSLLSLLYLFLASITEAVISFLLSTLISVVLIPMLFMFISVVIKLLINNFTVFKTTAVKIIPIVNVSYDGIKCEAIYLVPIWILLFSLLYCSIYCVKDLKS